MTDSTNTTSSVAAALKAAKAASNLAAGSSDGSSTPAAGTTNAPAAASTKKTRTPKAPKAPKVPKEKPAKDPKVKVDTAWMLVLTEKVNTHFVDLLTKDNPAVAEHGKPTINFAVAKNKGIPVSLTPRVIYANGAIQSPGPAGRLGFCTDKNFDEWFVKVEEKLKSAMERKPRLKGKAPAKTSFWAPIADKLRVTLGDKYSVRSTGARLAIHQVPEDKPETPVAEWPLKAAFKQDGEKITLSSAKGDIETVNPLLAKVLEAVAQK